MHNTLHVAFCGGGSGGHLTPAIAVLDALQRRQNHCHALFFTSGRSLDAQMLQRIASQQPHRIVPLPVVSSRRRLAYATAVARSVLICVKTMKQRRPDVAVGLGGFASIPGIVAARLLRIPILLLEPNTIPGRANRKLARMADVTCFGWPLAEQTLQQWPTRIVQTGVPVCVSGTPAASRQADSQNHQLLILGGSLGARSVTQLVNTALQQISVPDHWTILHQIGRTAKTRSDQDARGDRALFEDTKRVRFVQLLEDVPATLQRSSLVVSRAGAVTLAEIAAAAIPAVLIPLSGAADDHQTKNAHVFSSAHAADVVDEDSPNAVADLVRALTELMQSSELRTERAANAGRLASRDAADRVAVEIQKLADV